MAEVILVKSNHIERELAKLLAHRLLIQHAQHRILTMYRGHDGDAEVYQSSLVLHSEAAVLRDTALGDIELAHDLYARDDRRVVLLRDRLHSLLQHAIDAVLHEHRIVLSFDVDITCATFQGGEDRRVHEANDRTDVFFRRQTLDGDGLVAGFIFTHDVEGEPLGGLVEHPLRLLRLLENLLDLSQRCDLGVHALVQQQANFVDHHQPTRI